MKNPFNQVLLAAMLAAGTFTAAQAQQVPAQMPPPPAPAGPGPRKPMPPNDRRGGPGRPDQEITKLTVLAGTVNKAVANDRFEYNGFLLTTGTGSVTVTYPPHLGEKIFSLAKAGTTVKATGFYRSNPQGINQFQLVTLEANGTTVIDTPPAPPAVVATPQQINLKATIKELRYNLNNDVSGFTLSSGEVIGIPPHIAQQLGSQLKAGEAVGVTGFVEPKKQGVVYSQNLVFVKAQTLNLNGQAYLVR